MEIKEAIKIWQEEYDVHYKDVTNKEATRYFLDQGEGLKVLLDLAERYDKVGGIMPEKKIIKDFDISDTDAWQYPIFNQALDLCTLAIARKLEGYEKKIKELEEKYTVQLYANMAMVERIREREETCEGESEMNAKLEDKNKELKKEIDRLKKLEGLEEVIKSIPVYDEVLDEGRTRGVYLDDIIKEKGCKILAKAIRDMICS